jgi:[acyl-carrier-protein] S-malonyltransferase
MGRDLADAFPEARAVFDEVDEALAQKLSTLMWEGPEDELTLTANAQPALMAVSLAAIRVLEARGLVLKDKVAYVAGHSLGEYSALAAAGTFSVADTARLLRIRGNAMQAAVPVGEGAMAAIIGLDQDEVEQACAEAAKGSVCQIANDNGGGQLVISGAKPALMQPAAEAMRAALADVQKNAPAVPVIANVTVSPLTDPQEIAARLVEQVTGRVRWRETVEWFAANGVGTLYEIGSGKVLSGLARRIDRSVATVNIGVAADIDAALAALA